MTKGKYVVENLSQGATVLEGEEPKKYDFEIVELYQDAEIDENTLLNQPSLARSCTKAHAG